MATLIKQIHDLIGLAIDKGYTNYITASQIDDVVDSAQMELFRQLLRQYPKDSRTREHLLPFQVRNTSITVSAKVASLPTACEYPIEFWRTATGVDYPIEIVESGAFRRRLRDVVDPPSETNLIGHVYYDSAKKIELSNQVTPIAMTYFKRPPKPAYGTTAVNGQYVYDETTTTDVSWSPMVHDILIQKSLAPLGLNMRDGQVQRAGQPTEPKEGTL